MLAASRVRSNVPPQNLEATPVAAVPAAAAYGLGEHPAVLVTDTKPAVMAQHEAPGQQPGRLPPAAPVQELESAFASQSQAPIALIGAPLPVDVVPAGQQPQPGPGQSR